jgi:DNA-binding beta-propeller fold protein YncE
MAVSPDGKHVAVSASTGNVVHILKLKTGEEVLTFESGDSPHENVYSADGTKIFHASIGLVYTPVDDPSGDTSKGDRYFQIVDAKTGEILRRVDMSERLAAAGYPDMSAAVRPMTITKDERLAFLQVSFYHGYVEYNIKRNKVRRIVDLPISDEARDTPREQYVLDSAHHGIALNHNDKRLCVAGTMSDYVAIVSRKTRRYKIFRDGKKPYWSTASKNGKRCFVSWSGSDKVSVYSFKKRKRVGEFEVGFHPQRIREGNVSASWIKMQIETG